MLCWRHNIVKRDSLPSPSVRVEPLKYFEENSKNPLTNQFKYVIIYMSRGKGLQSPMTEKEYNKNENKRSQSHT
jgi:hypothetical protein